MLFSQTCRHISHLILYHIPHLAWLDVFLFFFQFWIFWPIWPLCCVLGHFKVGPEFKSKLYQYCIYIYFWSKELQSKCVKNIHKRMPQAILLSTYSSIHWEITCWALKEKDKQNNAFQYIFTALWRQSAAANQGSQSSCITLFLWACPDITHSVPGQCEGIKLTGSQLSRNYRGKP